MTSPFADPKAWDVFYLAGDPSPGLCESVAGATNPRTWDEQKSTGSSGAGLVYQGDGLAKFMVRIKLWTRDHFVQWETWKRHLVPPSANSPDALEAEHPQLSLLPVPISAVVVDVAGAPEPEGDYWIAEIWFRQYRKPKPAQAKPKGAKTTDQSDADNQPETGDAIDQYLDDLMDEVDGLL